MNKLRINKANTEDIPALAELLSELFSLEVEFAPNPDNHTRGLKKIIDNPETGIILIARQDKQIIGMVNLLFTVSTALGQKVAILEDMVVARHFRQTGVGGRLIYAAITYAKEEKCARITLLTDKSNTTAQRFYQQNGFTQSAMIPMRMSLPTE